MLDVTQNTTLFEPLVLPNGQIIPNRIAKAAMEENMADQHQAPSQALKQLYKTWADGEPGLLLTRKALRAYPGQIAWAALTQPLQAGGPLSSREAVRCRAVSLNRSANGP